MVWIRFAVALGQFRQFARDGVIGLLVDVLEGEFLKLLAHVLHAHASGQRRIDIHRFFGDAGALFRRHMLERPHVVQPVGELDQKHPHIIGDRQQQFAQVFGLLGPLGDKIELLDLGQPLDKRPISSPNSSSISARVAEVSSIVSCSSATAMVASSSRISVRIAATSSGWEK
jgi:hypothetical protein